MKALTIKRDLRISEYDGERDGWMDPDIDWDHVSLDDKHDIFFNDNALEEPDVIFARVGIHPKIPLPAFVVGRDGEKTGEPSMTAEELEAIVR